MSNTTGAEHKASNDSIDDQGSYASWSSTFKELKDTPAARLLGILALLDPDSIPEDLLDGFARSTSEDIPPLKNTATYQLATASLQRHALMREDKEKGTISIQRPVQEANIRYLQSTDQLQQAFEDATTCLSRVYPRQKKGGSMFDSFSECKLFTPQLLSLEKNYKNIKENEADSNNKKTLHAFPLLAELLCHGGWYLYETGTDEVAVQALHTAKEICDEFYGTRADPLTALVYSNIGVVLSNRNQGAEALEVGMRALSIRRQCLPEGHFQIGESLNNCAGGFHDLDQLEDAQKLFEESVSIQENNPVRNERLLEGAYSNLGRNLMALRRFEEAEQAFEKARSLHGALGADLFFVSMTLFLIGNLRMYQGRWEEAEREYGEALKVRMTCLGPKHKLTGVSFHQLARLLHRRGLDDGEEGSIQLLRNALEIFESDPSEPGLVPRSKFLLSLILGKIADRMGDIAVAEESQRHRQEAILLVKQEPLFAGISYAEEKDWEMLVQYEYR